ncbi:MAG: 7-cyano-7-deazaguanine synthase, partial [Thermococcus sp.]
MLEDVVEEIREFSRKSGVHRKKVLVLFSGGKDSSLVLYLLKKAGLDVSALTFFHRWSWRETLNWAMRFTKNLGV